MKVGISLVLPTVDTRIPELTRLVESLLDQRCTDLEVVVVDQNADDRLNEPISRWRECLAITHLRSSPGLSRARNAGLRAVTRDIVAFPDDDCWYPPGVLGVVQKRLSSHPAWAGLSARVVDEAGMPCAGKWDPTGGPLTARNAWNRAVSVSLFLRRTTVQAVGDFDETLGAGAGTPWESGEETDYVLRALEKGLHLEYIPDIAIGHPRTRYEHPEVRSKAYRYALGMGRVLRKHRYPFWFVVLVWLRTSGGGVRAMLAGDLARARLSTAILRGRLRGYLTGA